LEKIVCAIRGGDSSRRAQERAIALAKERHGCVIFIHVIDINRVEGVGAAIADALYSEMEHIGTSLLSIAAERALAHGVKAETVVLDGPVPVALEKYLRESQATTLVIGSPDNDPSHNVFDSDSLNVFVEHLQTTLGIAVEVV
jgi:nucleotide-binding universal stress UspA family protein